MILTGQMLLPNKCLITLTQETLGRREYLWFRLKPSDLTNASIRTRSGIIEKAKVTITLGLIVTTSLKTHSKTSDSLQLIKMVIFTL